VLATNPAHSWINQGHLHDVLRHLDCLVVQDMYHDTETARLADVMLPAAGWGEKEGTFINSERRLGVIKKVRKAPGQALADFHIFQLVARAWGCDEMFRSWSSPEAVFQHLKALSKDRPCDIRGIDDYVMLDREGGIQWPFSEGAILETNERRLFEDGRFFTDDGRARFLHSEPAPMPEPTDERYPLVLLTGRGTSAQWHTQTRTKRSDVLRQLAPEECYVEVSPVDAKQLGLVPGELLNVSSRRAGIRARAFITNTVQPGQVFIPMHYEEMNQLTFSAFDPHSRQPAYKACAVRLTRANQMGAG
jgi:assimilatory nitrate reductase catalytic subunit